MKRDCATLSLSCWKEKKKKKEEEKYWANRFKRRRAAIVERIVSLFQRARLKATALCASIETQCVYRTEETGTATRAITKKPLQHTSSLQPYFIHLYISNMLYIYIYIYYIELILSVCLWVQSIGEHHPYWSCRDTDVIAMDYTYDRLQPAFIVFSWKYSESSHGGMNFLESVRKRWCFRWRCEVCWCKSCKNKGWKSSKIVLIASWNCWNKVWRPKILPKNIFTRWWMLRFRYQKFKRNNKDWKNWQIKVR